MCSHHDVGMSTLIRALWVHTWILGLIRDDAANKVWLCAAQVSHQLVQVLLHLKVLFSLINIFLGNFISMTLFMHFIFCLSCFFPSPLHPVRLTLCNWETVWKDAAFLFLILVSDFGSLADKTEEITTIYRGL